MKFRALFLTAALGVAAAFGAASPAQAAEGRYRGYVRHHDVRLFRPYYRPYRAYGYYGYYGPYAGVYAVPGPYAYAYGPYPRYYGPGVRFGIRLGW